MSGDHLEGFRQRLRRPSEGTAAGGADAAPEPADGEYRAWGKSHPESQGDRLDVRLCPSAPEIEEEGDEVALHYLMRITYTHSKRLGDRVTLCFADQLITLEGRHLRDFRRDLRAGKADYVQLFDAKRWPAQPDGKPIIIQIRTENIGNSKRNAG